MISNKRKERNNFLSRCFSWCACSYNLSWHLCFIWLSWINFIWSFKLLREVNNISQNSHLKSSERAEWFILRWGFINIVFWKFWNNQRFHLLWPLISSEAWASKPHLFRPPCRYQSNFSGFKKNNSKCIQKLIKMCQKF